MNDALVMQTSSKSVPVDEALLAATLRVLREHGWDGLTLERVSEVAGRSRSTLWRQGLSRDALMAALVGELAADFRDAMYPVLTSSGTGRERLERSLSALCGVLDRHLPLMLATDEAFHQATAPGKPPDYLHPFIQFLREGSADGSLAPIDDVVETADVLMNSVLWTYTHLRGRHEWAPARARSAILGLVLHGVIPPPTKE
jgi:AcrR family transcriptional regulator